MTSSDDFPSYDADDALVASVRAERVARVAVYPVDETMVVLGRGSDAAVELDRGRIDAHGVPICRRRGGGCAVVLDSGNVVASVAFPTRGFAENQAWFDAITRWMIDAFRRIGIEGVYHDGISDLVLGDRKVGGSCIHRTVDSLYYSVSLLVQPDIEQVEDYLRHPPKEPDYRRRRSHRDFMGSLAEFPVAADVPTFVRALRGALSLDRFEPPTPLDVG